MADVTFLISLVTGALLTISETMPFINKIKSNGIIHSIVNHLKYSITQSHQETRPLLPQLEPPRQNDSQLSHQSVLQQSLLQQSVLQQSLLQQSLLQQSISQQSLLLQELIEQHRKLHDKLVELKNANVS